MTSTIDTRALEGLTAESDDLQSDALKDARASLPFLEEIAADRRRNGIEFPDTKTVQRMNMERRSFLRNGALGAGALAARGVVAGGFTALLGSIAARPVAADANLDIQILQTAASLENLAVATYKAAAGLSFMKAVPPAIIAFVMKTIEQHTEHGQAFNAQAKVLGGKEQTTTNSKYQKVVDDALPGLKTPLDVVKFAAVLEEVATDTYIFDLTQLQDVDSKKAIGSVAGVESQHLAVLRAVGALLEGGAPELVAIPTDVAKLPAAAGSVSFPGAVEEYTKDGTAAPETGAVK